MSNKREVLLALSTWMALQDFGTAALVLNTQHSHSALQVWSHHTTPVSTA